MMFFLKLTFLYFKSLAKFHTLTCRMSLFAPHDDFVENTDSTVSEFDSDSEEENYMPPPKPFITPTVNTRTTWLDIQIGTSRVRSESPKRYDADAQSHKANLQSRNMTRSLPILHCSRSTYNRIAGQTILVSVAELSKVRNRSEVECRVAEFSLLLEDL